MSEIEPAAPVLLTDLETEFHMSKTVGGDGHLPRGNQEHIKSYHSSDGKPVRTPAFTVDQVMSSPVVSLTGDSDLRTGAALMEGRRFRHIPIINPKGVMEGIVSDRDLLRAHEVPSTLLSSLMSKTVRTVVSGTSIRAAASILLKERIGALIVLDFKKNPIGIITNADILKAIVEKAPIELWA